MQNTKKYDNILIMAPKSSLWQNPLTPKLIIELLKRNDLLTYVHAIREQQLVSFVLPEVSCQNWGDNDIPLFLAHT